MLAALLALAPLSARAAAPQVPPLVEAAKTGDLAAVFRVRVFGARCRRVAASRADKIDKHTDTYILTLVALLLPPPLLLLLLLLLLVVALLLLLLRVCEMSVPPLLQAILSRKS